MNQSTGLQPSANFNKGDKVIIIDGPFSNFTGVVVQVAANLLTVSIEFAGNPMNVELDSQ